MPMPEHLTPERWIAQVFGSREALGGGVVKRQLRDVERLVGLEAFLHEVQRRGFQAVTNNRHIVIFCNALPIRRARPTGLEGPSSCRLEAAGNAGCNPRPEGAARRLPPPLAAPPPAR